MTGSEQRPSDRRSGHDASGRSEAAAGVVYVVAAYLLWGLSPIFWKWISHVPSSELVAHRIVWSAVLMVPILTWQRRWGSLRGVLRTGRTFLALVGTTVLIATNWFTYIWAVNHERVLEASLGYFINPLVNVVLGTIFLRERLRFWQWISVALALLGVAVLTVRVGRLPWIALLLAFSFGFYGLVRKTVAASPEEGLAFETWLLSPLLVTWLVLKGWGGEGAFGRSDLLTHVLLVATGLITALPMIWFTHGARRLPFATVGILQYIAPTVQFLLAVLVFREPFEQDHLAAFVLIWIAVVVFTADLRREWLRLRPPPTPRP